MQRTLQDILAAIQDSCVRYSIDEIGSCRVDMLTDQVALQRIHDLLPGAKTVIVMLKKIPDGMIGHAHDSRYQEAATQTFDDLCKASEEIALCLRLSGIAAVWPGIEETPHQKEIAVRAGLGSIGDAKLFISSRFGIDVHLESLIAAENIEFPRKGTIDFRCDNCGLCVDVCPVSAIGPDGVDRNRCLQYRRTEVQEYNGMRTRFCGLCMKICPQR